MTPQNIDINRNIRVIGYLKNGLDICAFLVCGIRIIANNYCKTQTQYLGAYWE